MPALVVGRGFSRALSVLRCFSAQSLDRFSLDLLLLEQFYLRGSGARDRLSGPFVSLSDREPLLEDWILG